MEIEYKDQSQLYDNDFARRQITKENEVLDEEEVVIQEPEDNIFWPIPSDIDEFNKQEEEDQIETLYRLKENIKKSYDRKEVDLVQDIFIKSRVPELIYGIFQETPSTTVLEYACDIIDNWIYYQFNPDVWDNNELLTFILIFATSNSKNLTPNIFETSINIISKFVAIKKDDFFKIFDLRKIINRIVNSFKENLFFNTRNLLTQLLNSIFSNISEFDVNDVLILGDLFNLLPECETLDYFSDLMSCALNLCERSQEFAYCFVQNVDINSIFKQISEIPTELQYSIIQLISFFISTGDQVLIESFMPYFEWSYIIPIWKRHYDEEVDSDDSKENIILALQEIAVNLIVINPELADKEGASLLFRYICIDINMDDYISKLHTITSITKLFSVPNANIIKYLIEQNYIQIASDYLSAAKHCAVSDIIDSIHYIAQYAENFSLRDVIEKMASTEIFDILPEMVESDDIIVAESAQALLNDETLTLFRSYLKSPS